MAVFSWTVRVVMSASERDHHENLIEGLRVAGAIILHRNTPTGCCFDLRTPAHLSLHESSKGWAEETASAWTTLGFNAVRAPEWRVPNEPPSPFEQPLTTHQET